MLTEAFAITYYYIIGLIALSIFLPNFPKLLSAVIAPALGALFFVSLIALFLLVNSLLPIVLPYKTILLVLFTTLILIRLKYYLSWEPVQYLFPVCMLAFYTLLALIFNHLRLTELSGDSGVMMSLANALFIFLNNNMSHLPHSQIFDSFSSYPIFIPAIHTLAYLNKTKALLHGLQPTLYISLLLSIASMLYHLIKPQLATKLALCTVTIALVWIGSSYLIMYQIFYINGNLMTGLFLSIALCSLFLFQQEKQTYWLGLFFIGLTSYAFLRMESPLYTAMLLIILLSNGKNYKIEHPRLKLALLILGVIYSLWYAFIIQHIATSGIVGTTTATTQIGLLWLSIIALCLKDKKVIPTIMNRAPLLLFCAICIALIATFILKPHHMYLSLINVYSSLFTGGGYWGSIWYSIAALYIACLFIKPSHIISKNINYLLPSYILLTITLAFFRPPYHVGPLDSANRIMVQLLPVIIIFLIAKFSLLTNAVPSKITYRPT